jgi:8-oxo-dGTP diphosphatase
MEIPTELDHVDPGDEAGDRSCPTVDVRVVLFTLSNGALLIATPTRSDFGGIPRGVPVRGESLDAAARRIVRDAVHIHEQYLEQLSTLSVTETPDRWSIIVGYIALVCSTDEPKSSELLTWSAIDSRPELSESDRMVIDYAVLRLRAKLGYTNIAFYLMPSLFTLTELQNAYETILDRRMDKRNFRRRMIASGILEETEEKRRDGSHRPAALYRFRADLDTASYLTPPWSDPADGPAA